MRTARFAARLSVLLLALSTSPAFAQLSDTDRKALADAMLIEGGRDGVAISGFAGLPTLNRPDASLQFLFVNGRPVRDRLLLGVVRAAYGDTVPKGRHPLVALFIALPPTEVTVVPGNHDVYTFESVRARRFREYFEPYMPSEHLPCRVQLPGGTPLVLTPTVCANVLSSAGRIGAAQVAETRKLIENAGHGPVLVMGHYPVLHETHAYRSTPSRQLRNAEALREALGVGGRHVLYLAGHVHRFSCVRDRAHKHLTHVTTNAFFLQRRGDSVDGAFTEIHVEERDFRVRSHWHEGDSWRAREEAPR